MISGHKIIIDGTYALQNYTYNPDTGNLASNAGVTYTYGDNNHKHAVTGTSSGNIYSYDANGNQTSRRVGGITYTLIYDAESRLVQVKLGKTIQATYTYDGDGNRVKTVVGSTTTTYIGNYLERECINTTCTLKRYYYAAGQRVALRKGDGTLYFLLTDHLGSTAITATSSGGRDAELRYYPWGGTRYTYGTTPTSYRYTGQREAEVGLYYYGARYYDPQLGRFASPDSIIPNPGDPVAWDRYAYTANNPVKYIDPSGHMLCEEMPWEEDCVNTPEQLYRGYQARGVPLRFSRLPVGIDKFSWLQWFGATDFAYFDHKNFLEGKANYNYDTYCQGMHCGIDLGANWGDSVYAGIYGEVVNSYNAGSNGGWSVTVQYGDYQVLYQHLSSVSVGLGDIVSPDTLIGGIGNPTGNESNGNYHLHMEVRHDADNDSGGWAELVENPLNFMSVQQIQALQVRADEFIGNSPNNYDPLLSFSYWYTNDILSQPNPIHISGDVLWR